MLDICATLRKKERGRTRREKGSRDRGDRGGVCTRSSRWIQNELPSKTTVLNLSTIIGNDVEGFSPRWRAVEKRREGKNDREMIPSSDEGSESESRTMEGGERISLVWLELLYCKFMILQICLYICCSNMSDRIVTSVWRKSVGEFLYG